MTMLARGYSRTNRVDFSLTVGSSTATVEGNSGTFYGYSMIDLALGSMVPTYWNGLQVARVWRLKPVSGNQELHVCFYQPPGSDIPRALTFKSVTVNGLTMLRSDATLKIFDGALGGQVGTPYWKLAWNVTSQPNLLGDGAAGSGAVVACSIQDN